MDVLGINGRVHTPRRMVIFTVFSGQEQMDVLGMRGRAHTQPVRVIFTFFGGREKMDVLGMNGRVHTPHRMVILNKNETINQLNLTIITICFLLVIYYDTPFRLPKTTYFLLQYAQNWLIVSFLLDIAGLVASRLEDITQYSDAIRLG